MENEQFTDENEQKSLNSILGTFKDVESLKKSYDSLRSEFTRKSQELSRLNKLVGDKEQNTPPNAEQPETEEEKVEEQQNEQQLPFWEKEGWQQNTVKFFNDYDLSSEEKYELAKILVEDKNVETSAFPLHSAYITLLKQRLVPKETLLDDEEFLSSYVYNNKKITEHIIANYLESINKRDSVPEVMPSFAANFGEQTPKTPKTLNEAKQLASKYFD